MSNLYNRFSSLCVFSKQEQLLDDNEPILQKNSKWFENNWSVQKPFNFFGWYHKYMFKGDIQIFIDDEELKKLKKNSKSNIK